VTIRKSLHFFVIFFQRQRDDREKRKFSFARRQRQRESQPIRTEKSVPAGEEDKVPSRQEIRRRGERDGGDFPYALKQDATGKGKWRRESRLSNLSAMPKTRRTGSREHRHFGEKRLELLSPSLSFLQHRRALKARRRPVDGRIVAQTGQRGKRGNVEPSTLIPDSCRIMPLIQSRWPVTTIKRNNKHHYSLSIPRGREREGKCVLRVGSNGACSEGDLKTCREDFGVASGYLAPARGSLNNSRLRFWTCRPECRGSQQRFPTFGMFRFSHGDERAASVTPDS